MSSLHILCQFDFPTATRRLWDGSGPYVDPEGNIWLGCAEVVGLDAVEAAINGEAYVLSMGVSAVDPEMANLAWQDHQEGNVIGSRVLILLQECDDNDQPVGTPDIKFTGRIDNIKFGEEVEGEGVMSSVVIDVSNRFTLRKIIGGTVLSDVDQKARSALLNPSAPPDRFCERVPALADKTIVWPRLS